MNLKIAISMLSILMFKNMSEVRAQSSLVPPLLSPAVISLAATSTAGKIRITWKNISGARTHTLRYGLVAYNQVEPLCSTSFGAGKLAMTSSAYPPVSATLPAESSVEIPYNKNLLKQKLCFYVQTTVETRLGPVSPTQSLIIAAASALAVPSNIKITPDPLAIYYNNKGKIKVTWDAVPNATDYLITTCLNSGFFNNTPCKNYPYSGYATATSSGTQSYFFPYALDLKDRNYSFKITARPSSKSTLYLNSQPSNSDFLSPTSNINIPKAIALDQPAAPAMSVVHVPRSTKPNVPGAYKELTLNWGAHPIAKAGYYSIRYSIIVKNSSNIVCKPGVLSVLVKAPLTSHSFRNSDSLNYTFCGTITALPEYTSTTNLPSLPSASFEIQY